MKVCLISFDYWDFDQHIIKELKQREGVEAAHIDISKFSYKYASPLHRVANTFNKVFLKKNIKKIKRQEHVLEQLKALGMQDIILVIRPDLLDRDTHILIKQQTKKYLAYLYDSTKRFPVLPRLENIFDAIYSFDEDDVAKYSFTHITNYIYLPKHEIKPSAAFDYRVFIVMSADERLPLLNTIAKELNKLKVSFKFVVRVTKKTDPENNPGIEYSEKEIRPEELPGYLEKAEMFLDIVRLGHNGLSFRVFEALAHQKKLITTNASIKNYEFYNPNNILVIDPDNLAISASFFETPYNPLPEELYNKYTIKHFVDTIFFN
ncbi:hypothetical protein AAEO56_07295 [Flavobacterium sp. DGU11]|uniref:Uncharacterized protein n=1 Tax=Flavobacterium arundinis TaxID=3139143 RepID=A0ABU9HX02_9FLAO